jgi:hypothetical protein
MSYPINYPTPQGANIQIFSQAGSTSDWVKPQGASFVWFTLIGGGGGSASGNSGIYDGSGAGSAAVTNFMCPAFLIPDVLSVQIGDGGTGGSGNNTNGNNGNPTKIIYQQKDGTGYELLSANGGNASLASSTSGGAGGAAMTANAFTAMGFFKSTSGQSGTYNTQVTASATTFLGGGNGASGSSSQVLGNYGYLVPSAGGSKGYFQFQPIIVGLGGQRTSTTTIDNLTTVSGGIGCGAGGVITFSPYGLKGGPGIAVIITW